MGGLYETLARKVREQAIFQKYPRESLRWWLEDTGYEIFEVDPVQSQQAAARALGQVDEFVGIDLCFDSVTLSRAADRNNKDESGGIRYFSHPLVV